MEKNNQLLNEGYKYVKALMSQQINSEELLIQHNRVKELMGLKPATKEEFKQISDSFKDLSVNNPGQNN